MENQKIAVVTGSSSGIGLETSLYLAKNGFKTYATMRNLSKAENIKQRIDTENLPIEILQLDVTDDTSVRNAINKILEKEGRVDFDWKEVFEIFKKPNVKKVKVSFPDVDEEKIKKVLVEAHDFSPDRVERQLEKLREVKRKGAQKTLF